MGLGIVWAHALSPQPLKKGIASHLSGGADLRRRYHGCVPADRAPRTAGRRPS